MVDLDEFALAKLAREMVMAIRKYDVIFADFGITEEDYYEISKLDYYKRLKDAIALEWNSPLSAAERTRLISASFAEQGALVAGKRMMDPKEPSDNVIEIWKQFCKNGGIGAEKTGVPAGERFIITINLGADSEHYDKSIEVSPQELVLDSEPVPTMKTINGKEA